MFSGLRNKLDGKFKYGFKFNGIESGQIEPPATLDYIIFPVSKIDRDYRLQTFGQNLSKAVNTAFLLLKNVSEIKEKTIIVTI